MIENTINDDKTIEDGKDVSGEAAALAAKAEEAVSANGLNEKYEYVSDGKVVEEWTSSNEPKYVEGLKTGEEYTLRETIAPDGYTITSDTKFTIDAKTGEVKSNGTQCNAADPGQGR